jgi:hypothetical protein
MSPPPAPEAKVHIGKSFSHFSPHSHSSHVDHGRHTGQLQRSQGFPGAQGAQGPQQSGHHFTFQRGDSFTPSKAPTSPTQQGAGAQGDGVPWIGQMKPTGADASYKNADQNCGPAVMAMIARERGMGKGMDDADLITELGKVGQTDGTGTTGNGLIAMADKMGLKSEAQPGANSQWVMSQLAQGKDVVSNGDYHALPQHPNANETSPHYILLTGIDAQGNIMVEDPMDPNVRSITPDQLDAYNRAQPEGGFNIAFD